MSGRRPADPVNITRQVDARPAMTVRPSKLSLPPLLGLVAGVAMFASQALAQTAQKQVKTSVGGTSVELLIMPGHCQLERSNPSDVRAIELVERLTAGSNQLHLFAADCKELTAWRAGTRPTLGSYSQVQSMMALHGKSFAGEETVTIKGICDNMRKQGGELTTTAEAQVKARIAAGREAIKIQNVSLLGVLGEDANGCYVGLIIGGKTEAGAQKSQLCVFATTVLNGKIVYLYQYAETVDEATVQRLIGSVKAHAKAHVIANTPR
jgi:hypothetical protein